MPRTLPPSRLRRARFCAELGLPVGAALSCGAASEGCTRFIGVLDSHRYKVVLALAQLGGPPSDRVGPWRSGDCKSSFPDTFEPERIRTTQCEGVQLWQ